MRAGKRNSRGATVVLLYQRAKTEYAVTEAGRPAQCREDAEFVWRSGLVLCRNADGFVPARLAS